MADDMTILVKKLQEQIKELQGYELMREPYCKVTNDMLSNMEDSIAEVIGPLTEFDEVQEFIHG